MQPRVTLSIILLVYCLPLTAGAQTVKMKDRSDWWSIANEKSYGPDVKPSNQEIDAKNFTIAGIQLDSGLKILAKKLGRAPVVVRGDASTSRHQICYKPAEPSKINSNASERNTRRS